MEQNGIIEVLFSTEDIQDLRRLGKCLDSNIVPVSDVRNFLKLIQRKIDETSAGKPRRITRQEELKNKYRLKIRMA
jgi:hypothetical protein